MKKFFISLVVLFCFFLLLFGNVSFASMSVSTANDLTLKINKLYNNNVISEHVKDKMLLLINSWVNPSQNAQYYSDYYTIFIGKGNYYSSTTYNKLSTSNRLYFVNWRGSSEINNQSNSTSNANYVNWFSSNGGNGYNLINPTATSGNFSTTSWFPGDQALEGVYFYSNLNINTRRFQVPANTEYGGQYLIEPKLTYNNIKTNTIEVHYNGNTENFIKADYSDTVSSWRLGYFTNFNDSEVDEIYGSLYGFAGSSEQGVIYSDKVANFLWKKGIGTYSNNLYFPDNSDHAVFVNPQVITQYQGYTLMFEAFTNREEQEVINNTTYLYFVPYGSTATSGDLISPDFNSGLDWSFINSIEKISSSSSGNTEYIFNNFVNGNFLSGDIFAGFGYVDPSDSNQSFGFIHNLFNGVVNTLLDNSSEVTLNINVHGFQKTLYSSDFLVPNNPIKTFVTIFLIAGTIILLFQQFTAFYISIITLDISSLIKSTEVDYTFFM